MAEIERKQAMEYIKKPNGVSKTSLYDHFTKVLSTLLDKRPENNVGIFEDVSKACKTKVEQVQKEGNEKEDADIQILSSALLSQRLFESDPEKDGDVDNDEELETALPNLMTLNFFFEQAAVGLSKEEMFRVMLSLKMLVDSKPLQTVRFWGKIFGIENNYYIAEVDYREGELEEEEEEDEEEVKKVAISDFPGVVRA